MKSFIDISSDKIGIYGLDSPRFLEKKEVDKEIGKIIVDLDREYWIDEIIVLNWPWWFTNLRVGSLALNLLKTLKSDKITFYSISKPELYQIFYKKWWIPRYGILYIWQKSNVWLRDNEEMSLISMIKKADIDNYNNEYWPLYLDQVYDETYFWELDNQLKYTYWNWRLTLITHKWLSLEWDEIALHKVDKLEANYMIEPNVS